MIVVDVVLQVKDLVARSVLKGSAYERGHYAQGRTYFLDATGTGKDEAVGVAVDLSRSAVDSSGCRFLDDHGGRSGGGERTVAELQLESQR